MKNRNMLFKLGIVLLSTVVSVSGCSTKKNTDEKKKVKLVIATPPLLYGKDGGGTAENSSYTDFLNNAAEKFAAQYKEADVEFIVRGFDYVDEEKAIKEKLGTKDAPDVLFEGFFNMGSYIHSGYMVSLDDIIDEDVRKDISPRILSEGMYQNKTYMYPFYHLPNTLAYNAELFKEVGLDQYIAEKGKIANWSIDEWETILDTLAAKLPDGKFPMMMYAKNNQGDTHIMTLLRAFNSSFFSENGKFNLDTPEGIEALKWIQDGVEKGWFPPSSENLQLSDMMNLFQNKQLAISIMNPANLFIFDENNVDARQVNFPGGNGDGLSTTFVTGFGVFDNKDKTKIKVAKDFVQYVCSNPQFNKACLPNIPVRLSLQELYKDDIYMKQAYAENEKTLINFTDNLPNWAGVRNVFYKQIQNLLTKEKTPEQVAKDIDTYCNEAINEK